MAGGRTVDDVTMYITCQSDHMIGNTTYRSAEVIVLSVSDMIVLNNKLATQGDNYRVNIKLATQQHNINNKTQPINVIGGDLLDRHGGTRQCWQDVYAHATNQTGSFEKKNS
jgi:hypothetical protein